MPALETRPAKDSEPRCYRCFRPAEACFCDAIPAVDNQTDVLILQHRRERFHPFNTARIVNQSLRRCDLMTEHNVDLNRRFDSLPLSDRVGVLYPGNDAKLLSELSPAERPEQLIVIDGTWHHAKTLMRDIPRLQTLPRYRLAPETPGRYRIRREPNEHALSTLEATVSALRAIEPETEGLDRLLGAFERMVDDQLNHTPSATNWRANQSRRRGSANVPRVLTRELENVVVAYGEQEKGERLDRGARRGVRNRFRAKPILWTAERLVSGERFECAIQTDSGLESDFLDRLQLSEHDFADAVSVESFRERWRAFLRPTDHVAVYHSNTAKLLRNVDAEFSDTLILKSIHMKSHTKSDSLESFLVDQAIEAQVDGSSRASLRLANAVAFAKHLSQHEVAPQP
ncbi:tRNA-uridine aminocarboxypropyltransferase [Novipirellula rosea]|uniref:tRNA-uridine aminocarboxypropyltransferase n=1 Tax=Novipirellula rosea TaxID=1031540 RepID=A0ABP8MCM7_9BACT